MLLDDLNWKRVPAIDLEVDDRIFYGGKMAYIDEVITHRQNLEFTLRTEDDVRTIAAPFMRKFIVILDD